ncbi:rac GTPase-activating protein 1 [Symphorus nematophorus]
MVESRLVVEDVLSLCLQRISMEEDAVHTEQRMLEVCRNFEAVRKQWMLTDVELKKYKELLVKSDVAKAALEVKLKHTRNQLDVEMRKRFKIERDYHYLQRQMQLMCDILVHDSKSSVCLNDEQKSLLATFEQRGANVTLQRSSRRLCVIDESSFLSHSDISYDRTDDEVDLDTTVIKPLRSRARERRRSSMGPTVGAPLVKRGRGGGNISAELLERKTVEKEVETVVKATVTTPDPGAQIQVVLGFTQESPENPAWILEPESAAAAGGGDQTSVWFPCDNTEAEPEAEAQMEENAEEPVRHEFVSKTVIRPESCSSCGKRVRFGRMVVKCRSCRAVAHPECKQKLSDCCSATATATTQSSAHQNSLEGFAPLIHPRIPLLVRECVAEIERRGLEERGLYRVPGGERLVKELREQSLQCRTPLMLSKVHDINVVCGLLKDFLRRLKEPLVTFRLHRTFMEASELPDASMFQAVSKLPKPNRDTLAFLILHLHRVMRSPRCEMDQKNLARVFGPTIVGHGMSEPSPSTIMRDTNTQPKVVSRLLALPEAYWRHLLSIQTDQVSPSSTHSRDRGHGRFFKPLTSPELNTCYKTPAGGTMRTRRSSGTRKEVLHITQLIHTQDYSYIQDYTL